MAGFGGLHHSTCQISTAGLVRLYHGYPDTVSKPESIAVSVTLLPSSNWLAAAHRRRSRRYSAIPYIRDKTEDDRFFILTLFAIAYEINAAGRYAPDQLMDIQLAVGLPPAHYGTQYKRFAQYFLDRGMIGFEFNGKVYSICITEAICFPQALAATAPVFKQLQLGTVAKAIVIDTGPCAGINYA